MIVKIRHDKCGKEITVEDMGDSCYCPYCNEYIMSIREMLREKILNGGKHEPSHWGRT